MPRRSNIDDSDTRQRCFLCYGTGQVPNPAATGALMTCPACLGQGRVNPDGYDKAAVARYNALVKRYTNLG